MSRFPISGHHLEETSGADPKTLEETLSLHDGKRVSPPPWSRISFASSCRGGKDLVEGLTLDTHNPFRRKIFEAIFPSGEERLGSLKPRGADGVRDLVASLDRHALVQNDLGRLEFPPKSREENDANNFKRCGGESHHKGSKNLRTNSFKISGRRKCKKNSLSGVNLNDFISNLNPVLTFDPPNCSSYSRLKFCFERLSESSPESNSDARKWNGILTPKTAIHVQRKGKCRRGLISPKRVTTTKLPTKTSVTTTKLPTKTSVNCPFQSKTKEDKSRKPRRQLFLSSAYRERMATMHSDVSHFNLRRFSLSNFLTPLNDFIEWEKTLNCNRSLHSGLVSTEDVVSSLENGFRNIVIQDMDPPTDSQVHEDIVGSQDQDASGADSERDGTSASGSNYLPYGGERSRRLTCVSGCDSGIGVDITDEDFAFLELASENVASKPSEDDEGVGEEGGESSIYDVGAFCLHNLNTKFYIYAWKCVEFRLKRSRYF